MYCGTFMMIFRGLNKSGQLGTGTNENVLDQDTDELVEVDLGGDAVHSIAAGDEHVCARLEDASVKVSTLDQDRPIQLLSTSTSYHTCMCNWPH